MFQNQIELNGVTTIGHCSPIYATVYWLEERERVSKTVCFSPQDIADAINIRTNFTNGRAFEIEYRHEAIQT